MYAKLNNAQTVFESAPGEKREMVQQQIETIPETVTQEEVIGETKEEGSSEESTVGGVESEKAETVEQEKESPTEATENFSPKNFSIKQSLVSFGHESASGRKIDTIVLHSSYSPNGDPYSVSAVRGIWQSYGVAPHYMVARDGAVYQLVADKDIAYHAGEGTMPTSPAGKKDGRNNVNNFSIGVEILNTKDDEYTKAQYQAVKDLIAYLKGKYSIKSVVGHDDIAPGRKTDPWNFNWDKI